MGFTLRYLGGLLVFGAAIAALDAGVFLLLR
jgi:hypothetical protein